MPTLGQLKQGKLRHGLHRGSLVLVRLDSLSLPRVGLELALGV